MLMCTRMGIETNREIAGIEAGLSVPSRVFVSCPSRALTHVSAYLHGFLFGCTIWLLVER